MVGTGRRPNQEGLAALDVMDLPMLEARVQSLQPSVVLWAIKADHDEATLIDSGLGCVLAVLPPTARFVFVSSDAVFGRGCGPYFEDAPPAAPSADSPTAAYSSAKMRGEATVQASRRPTTVVRVGPLYGPDVHGRWDGRTTIMVQAFAAGRTVARAPNLVKSFVRVEDAAAVLARLMLAPAPGIVHVATPAKSYYDVARAVATATGYPVEQVRAAPVPADSPLPRNTALATRHPERLAGLRRALDFSGGALGGVGTSGVLPSATIGP